jgi:DNA invertase Pin-like site-specific DNA recombinase
LFNKSATRIGGAECVGMVAPNRRNNHRVSTKKQSDSNLGLAAQKTTVSSFCKDGQIIGEYTDIESGTRKGNNREGLKQAIQQAKESECKLVIAKLDRLSRNVLFITTLMESGVDFVACDMPTANKFTIHIFAALAEQEADLISQRTKAALTELKKSGKRLGSPKNLTKAAIDKGKEIRINNAFENENNVKATALIRVLKESGLSLTNVALKLNESGFRTRRRKKFQAVQVQRLYNRYCILQK